MRKTHQPEVIMERREQMQAGTGTAQPRLPLSFEIQIREASGERKPNSEWEILSLDLTLKTGSARTDINVPCCSVTWKGHGRLAPLIWLSWH